ncbi:NmrA family NAD(P)-binding protein [Streptomyces xanthochromogenes]|uniref:NmrA family NAD(P)-binding protein n=1 Tax=Streptomyces xanthochromogenes TaxID=67384 RepID=UPI00341F959A
MPSSSDIVLVTGATGQQGGATARALLTAGVPVRALVRDPRSKPAQAIRALGAELVQADLSYRSSLGPAVEGVRAVFSVQMPPMTENGVDFQGELSQATHLIDAAKAAGVRQFVQSSTSGVGAHTRAAGWTEGRWAHMADYFHTKQAIMDAVHSAGFARWTVIKPAFFMENLPLLAAKGPRGGLLTVLKPDTQLALVAVRDIGAAAAHALRDGARFHEVELELASELRTMEQIAHTLSAAWGVPVTAPCMNLEEALAAGMPKWGAGHEWNNAVLQPARPEFARELGIPLTTFAEWADEQLARVSS